MLVGHHPSPLQILSTGTARWRWCVFRGTEDKLRMSWRPFFPLCWNWINCLSPNEQRCSPILRVLCRHYLGQQPPHAWLLRRRLPRAPLWLTQGWDIQQQKCACMCVCEHSREKQILHNACLSLEEKETDQPKGVCLCCCVFDWEWLEDFCITITECSILDRRKIFYELVLQHASLIAQWLKVFQTDMLLCLIWLEYALCFSFIGVFFKCNDKNIFMRNS